MHTLSYAHQPGWSAGFPDVDPSRSLVLCFGASLFMDYTDPIMELVAAIGGPVSGCSTAGEILGDRVADDSLSVAVVEFDSTPVKLVAEPVSVHGAFDAGVGVARRLAGDDLRALFVLSDGLDVNGTELVRGINSVVSSSAIVTGGLAGDGSRLERTWVLADGKPTAGFVTAVGLYGDAVRIGHGSQSGWQQFGPERTVTKSRGNVVYELDEKPILALYKAYLGDLAVELPTSGVFFPLALRQPGREDHSVRTIVGMDEATQSLTFAGDLPQGHRVQLMYANLNRLVAGAGEAAATATAQSVPGDSLSIAISCAGRRLVLGQRTEDELEAVSRLLGDGTAQVGFYSYGELGPNAAGRCELQSQMMTLTTVGEVS